MSLLTQKRIRSTKNYKLLDDILLHNENGITHQHVWDYIYNKYKVLNSSIE